MRQLNGSKGNIATVSQEISRMMTAIDEIAFQTNLLVFHVAVEANRAGKVNSGYTAAVTALALCASEVAHNAIQLIENMMNCTADGAERKHQIENEFREREHRIPQVKGMTRDTATGPLKKLQGLE